MPKPYSPQTINEFGTYHFTDDLANAALADNEGATVLNLNFTEAKTLTKRLGFVTKNANVTSVATVPSGGTQFQPTTVRMLGVQRRSPTGSLANRLWFTDIAKAHVWTLEADYVTAVWTAVTTGNLQIDGAEWMILAGTPSLPYEMKLCRSTGGMCRFNVGGVCPGFTTSPAGTHLSLFKDRLFMINSLHTSGQESRLWFSDPTAYETWPANNFLDVAPANGEYCVATIPFNDQLVIFKNRSTYVLTADGQPTSWVLRMLHPTIGCVGRGTPLIISGFIYFLSNDGVYRTDGTTFERISEPIDVFIRTNTGSSTSGSVLGRDACFWDDKYILFLPDVVGDVKTLLVYDTRVDAWSRWQVATGVNLAGPVVYSELRPPTLIVGDQSVNKIYAMGQQIFQDNGSNYTVTWQSKMFTWGDPSKYKRNYLLTLDIGAMLTNTESVAVAHRKDALPTGSNHTPTTVTPTARTSYDLSRKLLKYRGAGYARFLGASISYTGNQPFDLFSVTWLNEVKDTVKQSN
jgi:hypothetical protein